MIAGVGTDILYMKHLSKEYLKEGDPFLQKVYSVKEIEQAGEREIPFHYYATRFAGKEAVFKSLGMQQQRVVFAEIEILNDSSGIPYVTLYGKVKQHAQEKGIADIYISLSYEEDYAVAFAVANSCKTGERIENSKQ